MKRVSQDPKKPRSRPGGHFVLLNAALAREWRRRGLVRAPKQRILDSEVAGHALACFGTAVGAAEWLSSPANGLDGRVPLMVAQTTRGRQRVIALLHRIDYNILG